MKTKDRKKRKRYINKHYKELYDDRTKRAWINIFVKAGILKWLL